MGTLVRRGILAGCVAAAALLVTGCATSAPEPSEPEVLSASKAGGLYLSAVCPVNAEWDRVDLEIDRLRLALGRDEASTRDAARALTDLAKASERSAKLLEPKRQSWPSVAEPAIDAVRETLRADRTQALRVAKLPAVELGGYVWQGGDEIAAAAAEARAALGLPADAEDACAQWSEQQTASEEPSASPKPSEESPKPKHSD